MIKLDFDLLGKIDVGHGLSEAEFAAFAPRLPELLQLVKGRGQGFYDVLDEQDVVSKIEVWAKQVLKSGLYDDLAILAIGGSSLGSICLQHSFGKLYSEKVKSTLRVKVLDNIDPEMLAEYQETVNLKKTLFVVITKSGGTPETLAQFLYFKDQLQRAGLDWKKQVVLITDPKKGLLRDLINKTPELVSFEIPENVGGRFSVLTSVGLVPAALMGLNLEQLLAGAKAAREVFWNESAEQNEIFKLAVAQFLLYSKGKSLNVIFPYVQKLIRFADWYRQLLAESIGKEKNLNGEKVNVGITPVFALGATDQHSQNQLYHEGPNDKLFLILDVEKSSVDLPIPLDENFAESLSYLKGVSFKRLLQTEMAGTLGALKQQDRPIIKISLDQLDEWHLGYLFFFFEAATALLGELFQINTFDQPGVELSKKLTREYLSKK